MLHNGFSFNGATCKMTWKFRGKDGRLLTTGLLQWGHVQNDVEILQLPRLTDGQRGGFNGATCKMTWKFALMLSLCKSLQELQWGHVQNDVEIDDPRHHVQLPLPASMGPRAK